jgi:hypothetical protein
MGLFGYGQGFASGLTAGTHAAKQWVDIYREAALREKLGEASQMGQVTEQVGGDQTMQHFQDNYVPQEGGPESAQEYLMQNPEIAAAIQKQKAGYTAEGQLFDDRTSALGAARSARDARVVDVMRTEDPEKALKMEQQQMQGRAAALQLQNAEAEQGATKEWGRLSELVDKGEMNEADRYESMVEWGAKNGSSFKQLQQWEADRKNALKEGVGEVYAILSGVRGGTVKPEAAADLMTKAFDNGDMRGYTVKSVDPKTGTVIAADKDGKEHTVEVESYARRYMTTPEIQKFDKEAASIAKLLSEGKYWDAKAKEVPEEAAFRREQRGALREDRAEGKRLREEQEAARQFHSIFSTPKDIDAMLEKDMKRAEGIVDPTEKADAVKAAYARADAATKALHIGMMAHEAGAKPSEAKTIANAVIAGPGKGWGLDDQNRAVMPLPGGKVFDITRFIEPADLNKYVELKKKQTKPKEQPAAAPAAAAPRTSAIQSSWYGSPSR